MFGIPAETEVQKPPFLVAKLATKLGLSDADKQSLQTDVKSIRISHVISNKSIPALKEGNEVKSITIILVEVSRENYNRDALCKISQSVKGQAIFIITFANLASVLLNQNGKAIRSSWEPNLVFTLKGLTLDTVWENIVKAVGQIDIEPGLTLSQQIELNTLRESTEKKIAAIEKKARAEKQPRKKFELAQQKKSMEQELIDKIATMKEEFKQQVIAYNIQNK